MYDMSILVDAWWRTWDLHLPSGGWYCSLRRPISTRTNFNTNKKLLALKRTQVIICGKWLPVGA